MHRKKLSCETWVVFSRHCECEETPSAKKNHGERNCEKKAMGNGTVRKRHEKRNREKLFEKVNHEFEGRPSAVQICVCKQGYERNEREKCVRKGHCFLKP